MQITFAPDLYNDFRHSFKKSLHEEVREEKHEKKILCCWAENCSILIYLFGVQMRANKKGRRNANDPLKEIHLFLCEYF